MIRRPCCALVATCIAQSSTILGPLTTEESQTAIHRLECDLAAFGEEENVSFGCFDHLPTLIRDLKIPIHYDLHLIIGIGIFKRSPRVEAVEACADWLFCIHILSAFIVESAMLYPQGVDRCKSVAALAGSSETHDEKISARYALSFAINGKVLTNFV